MTRQQRQRTLAILLLVLAVLVLGRHVLRRSGLSRSTDRGPAGATAAVSLVAPSLQKGARTRILRSLRAFLAEGGGLEAVEDSARPGRRVVLISLTRARQAALVAQGQGPSLDQALAGAAGLLASRASRSELWEGRLKVDIATSSGEGWEGLWLPEPDLIVLPEEVQSRRLVSSKGKLRWDRLREYLAESGRPPLALEESRAGEEASYLRVAFDSFMEGDGVPMRLYRGNDLLPELSPQALLAAAASGGEYLLRHQKDDGTFGYRYKPRKDTYDDGYNLLRHAGSCYALLELYRATEDERYLEAGRRGLESLLGFARPPKTGDAAAGFEVIVSPGDEAKLGGVALAVLALVEHRRVSADERWAPLAQRLARFLLFQQEESGYFRSKYFYGPPEPEPFESIYYPGEAILALVRLHGQDPRPEWLAAARRGADWLIGVRDAGKGAGDLPHDHWLLMALDELHATTGDERYAAHAERIAQAIVAAQRTSSERPDWVGSFYDPPRSTPTATRAEALVAMLWLARRRGVESRVYLESLLKMAAFERRCQLTVENTLYLPRPDRALGGFRRGLGDWEVRIDYVQHNISALLGLRSILLG